MFVLSSSKINRCASYYSSGKHDGFIVCHVFSSPINCTPQPTLAASLWFVDCTYRQHWQLWMASGYVYFILRCICDQTRLSACSEEFTLTQFVPWKNKGKGLALRVRLMSADSIVFKLLVYLQVPLGIVLLIKWFRPQNECRCGGKICQAALIMDC